jgi:hypothetical protein
VTLLSRYLWGTTRPARRRTTRRQKAQIIFGGVATFCVSRETIDWLLAEEGVPRDQLAGSVGPVAAVLTSLFNAVFGVVFDGQYANRAEIRN